MGLGSDACDADRCGLEGAEDDEVGGRATVSAPSSSRKLPPKRADADQEAVASHDQGGPRTGSQHEGQDQG